MSTNNIYSYFTAPNKDERTSIREKHFNLCEAFVGNANLVTPIKFNTEDEPESIRRQFYIQRVFEYSSSINDEILGMDFLFTALVHVYQKAESDKDNWRMYLLPLKLCAETYVAKYVSVYEKIALSAINITDFSKLYDKDNGKYTTRKHDSVIKSLEQCVDDFPAIQPLCEAINHIKAVLKDSHFDEIRNNAIHNFSNFDPLFRFERNVDTGFHMIEGSSVRSTFKDVIENQQVFDALKSLTGCFQKFLNEAMENYKDEVTS